MFNIELKNKVYYLKEKLILIIIYIFVFRQSVNSL